MIYEAYRTATQGEPGPVFIELPVNLMLIPGEADPIPEYDEGEPARIHDAAAVSAAVDLLRASRRPGLFVGWGARGALAEVSGIAELLQAPVATTLQGLSVITSYSIHYTKLYDGPLLLSVTRRRSRPLSSASIGGAHCPRRSRVARRATGRAAR